VGWRHQNALARAKSIGDGFEAKWRSMVNVERGYCEKRSVKSVVAALGPAIHVAPMK